MALPTAPPAACRACYPPGAAPAWCGILSPADGGLNLTVTLCHGEAPAAALDAACHGAGAACHGRHALLSRELLAQTVMRRARAALGEVPRWLPPKRRGPYGVHAGSINYGVASAEAEAVLDEPIPFATSYSDVLSWLLLSFDPPARYLEIGVSVGKNLHQLMRTSAAFGSRASSALLVGLDLESFNPVLLAHYPIAESTCRRWPTPAIVDDGSGAATLKADAESSVCQHTLSEHYGSLPPSAP